MARTPCSWVWCERQSKCALLCGGRKSACGCFSCGTLTGLDGPTLDRLVESLVLCPKAGALSVGLFVFWACFWPPLFLPPVCFHGKCHLYRVLGPCYGQGLRPNSAAQNKMEKSGAGEQLLAQEAERRSHRRLFPMRNALQSACGTFHSSASGSRRKGSCKVPASPARTTGRAAPSAAGRSAPPPRRPARAGCAASSSRGIAG